MAYTPTDEQKQVVERVRKKWDAADKLHQKFRPKWERLYRLYRSYRVDRDRFDWTQPRDVYPAVPEVQETWGAQMFIPYCFSTIETVVPRLLSHRPKMLILPKKGTPQQNAENMSLLIDRQQAQIDYELILQDVAKTACIYGLGVQKNRWRRKQEQITRLAPPEANPKGEWAPVTRMETTFDDPWAEWVDIFDFRWDPMARDLGDSCEYAFHRVWMSHDKVLERLRSGFWTGVAPEDVPEGGGQREHDASWKERWKAAGFEEASRADVHEVWEFESRDEIVTILDRQVPVRQTRFPYWHKQLTYSIYRPTRVQGEFVGVGEIEAIEDLQHEMNVLRRQRRDNATLVLNRVGFYQQGLFDPDEEISWRPGAMNPVPGDPREAVFFPPMPDIPGSSYQEEARIEANIDRTTGISDPIAGAPSSGDTTATEVQLVQAAANVRIQNKARLCEVELIKSAGRQWMLMNQQMIVTPRSYTVPEPQPGEMSPKYASVQIGPRELMGDMDLEPEGGATQPANVPQDRQDAMNILNLARQYPGEVDQHMALEYALTKFGVDQPKAWLQPQQAVPPQVLQILGDAGVDPGLIEFALQQAQMQDAASTQQDSGQGAANGEQALTAQEQNGAVAA